ncbi:MAG: DUF4270 domain-containing protein [Flavobacteriaceae bacterium]|nr:DUF4270 domain-containing protein [Flavobacteriaceae bacterium]
MTTKVVKVIKLIAIPVLFMTALISCEENLGGGIGTGVVDNDLFETTRETSKVISYNNNELKVKANKLGQYLLGIYKNDDMGQLNASIVSQMTFGYMDFGANPSIDSVILNIPYHSTRSDVDYPGGVPKWELDSIFRNQNSEYFIKVSELTTFLNAVDPSDPEKELDYFSDRIYTEGPVLYNGLFKPNSKDTALYITRSEIINENTMLPVVETITAPPSIKLALDSDYFQTNFLDNPSIFESLATFIEYFNGLSIQVEQNGANDTNLMSLNFIDSSVRIYYTNDNTVDETIRSARTAIFSFTGVTNNTYTRDYASSNAEPFLTSPNIVDGDTRLYLNGASGSIALLKLFTEEDLNELRAKNRLVNEATLVFYIDQTASMAILPERIFLYNYDNSTQIIDYLIDGPSVFGGFLERDANGNPEKYTFKLTTYISKVLDGEDPVDLSLLGLKVFNSSDTPTSLIDINVENYSWTPKGIVLHGNNSENIEKRVKLELVYTARKE